MSTEAVIRAVAYKEGDAWVVQGIEYDIAAHAWDPADLPSAFLRAVIDNVLITESLGRAPLEGIKRAPIRFEEMFNAAKAQVRSIEGVTSERLPVSGVDIRLAAVSAA